MSLKGHVDSIYGTIEHSGVFKDNTFRNIKKVKESALRVKLKSRPTILHDLDYD